MYVRASNRITPAQLHVLEYLKRHEAAGTMEIASALSVTRMAVRHHLQVLEKAGLVTFTLQRGGAGRPSFLYSPTGSAQQFFPDEYGAFARRLLRTIIQMDGEARLTAIFAQMAKGLVAQYGPRMVGKELRDRVGEMAKIQTEAGYMADWQQLGRDKFQLTEHNCALLEIARGCSHACECELKVMQDLLGATVTREEHIAQGDCCCRYVIQATPQSMDESRGGD